MSTWDERMTPRQRREPRLVRLEVCWRLVEPPSQKVIECGIYRTDAGLEVRCGYGDENLLRSQFAHEIGAAREIAEAWKDAVLAKGSFTDVATGDGE